MSTNSIFHEYDIRGLYPSEVNEAVFYNLGIAFWQVFKPGKVAIGRDSRLSSDTLFLYLASGLKKNGVKVIDLGRVSTSFCMWYNNHYKIDTLVVTASHNPKDFNGLKIYSYKNGPIDKSAGLSKMKEVFDNLSISQAFADIKKSVFKKHHPLDEYIKHYTKNFKIKGSKIRSVIDFSNGVAAKEYLAVLDKIKIGAVTLNESPNGNFPAHEPNPLLESSHKSIKVLMKSKKFDIGAIVDGDGDRIVFFDEKGDTVEPSYILALMAENFADQKKNKIIIRTVALSKIIDEIAKESGIKTIVTKVGHSIVQRAMKKNNAQIGGEKAGHYFFKDFYFGDSTLFAFLVLIKIISQRKTSFSSLIAPYKKYIIWPEINFPFEGRVDKIIGEIKEKFKDGKINELDGFSVDFSDYHFNLRKSNTENMWRLTLEGYNKEKMAEARRSIEKILSTK
jgi:phosphomannomutase